MHLFCVMVCDDIGDVDKRMEYSKQYIIKQYGSNQNRRKYLFITEYITMNPGVKKHSICLTGHLMLVWLLKVQPNKDFSRTLTKGKK